MSGEVNWLCEHICKSDCEQKLIKISSNCRNNEPEEEDQEFNPEENLKTLQVIQTIKETISFAKNSLPHQFYLKDSYTSHGLSVYTTSQLPAFTSIGPLQGTFSIILDDIMDRLGPFRLFGSIWVHSGPSG